MRIGIWKACGEFRVCYIATRNRKYYVCRDPHAHRELGWPMWAAGIMRRHPHGGWS